jgi:pimeloyl-ACP methyl ester carboxylesterase
VEPRLIAAPDGARIAVFAAGEPPAGAPQRPPLLLVHGTASDHTTWRVTAPLLAESRAVFTLDRRGRGASGDGPVYAIEREYEDIVAVAAAVARDASGQVDVFGHSYGGRIGLGAALRTSVIRRLIVYEGAPVHVRTARPARAQLGRLEADLAAGQPDRMLDRFLKAEVGFDDAGLAAYHANPVWPGRVAAAERTLLRELYAEMSPPAGLAALGGVRQPVLLVQGSESVEWFKRGTRRLAARLPDVRVIEIAGAAHAAHHTHAPELVRAVRGFLDG